MHLSEIVGQQTAVRTLRHALQSDCLPGTYLMVGPEGIGKYALAQALAQAACCVAPVHGPFDSCGTCASCLRSGSETHPDIVTLRPFGEHLQIWQFWDRPGRQLPGALSRTLIYTPVMGRRRVYVIEKSDRLTEQAANSLLKVLEEPPPYVLFILLAVHPARVLPTILSRSQVVRMSALGLEELSAFLETLTGVDRDRAQMLASYSEGRIGHAIALAKVPAVGDEIGRIIDFASGLPGAPGYRALRAAEQLRKLAGNTKALLGEDVPDGSEPSSPDGEPPAQKESAQKEKVGRKQFAAVFDLLITFYRDLLAVRVGSSSATLVHRDRFGLLVQLSALGDATRWTTCLNAILLARRRLDANANIALVTETLLMTLLER